MVQITLSSEQFQAIHDAADGIELLDPNGLPIGTVDTGVSMDDLRAVRDRMAAAEPGMPLAELLKRLAARRSTK